MPEHNMHDVATGLSFVKQIGMANDTLLFLSELVESCMTPEEIVAARAEAAAAVAEWENS